MTTTDTTPRGSIMNIVLPPLVFDDAVGTQNVIQQVKQTQLAMPTIRLHTHFRVPDLSALADLPHQTEFLDTFYEVITYKKKLMSSGWWLRSRHDSSDNETWQLKVIPPECEDLLSSCVPYYEFNDPAAICDALAVYLECDREDDILEYNVIPYMSIPFRRYCDVDSSLFVDVAWLKDTCYVVGSTSNSKLELPKAPHLMDRSDSKLVASKALAFLLLHDKDKYKAVTKEKYAHQLESFIESSTKPTTNR